MTKDEYLKKIKDNLQTLTIDEQNEALQYYCDYFDDAGFDEEKVMEELGTPEQVAEKIKADLSNALVKNTDKKEKTDSTKEASYETSLFYEFDKNSIKNLNFSFAAAEVVCISGPKFSIETRGILEENIYCGMDNDTLVCKNLNHFQNFRFFSHVRKSSFAPRILISIPDDLDLTNVNIRIDAGRFETHKIKCSCKQGHIEVGAGNCVINGLYSSNMNIHCGMGNLNLIGALKGNTNIDCGMGNIKLELTGNPDDYSYDAKVGLGSVEINNDKKSGIGKNYTQAKKSNHFSINCGMGSVKILIG